MAFSRSKRRINGLERYDAVRAAYPSLDSRIVSCRAIEMFGRALVAQTFVTASLGVVFSPEFAIDLYSDGLTRILLWRQVRFDRNRKRESGRLAEAVFWRRFSLGKQALKILEKI